MIGIAILAFVAALVMSEAVRDFSRSMRPNPDAVYREQRAAYFHRFGRPAEIMILGDSVLSDIDWHELFPGLSITSRSIRGESTQGALARIEDLKAVNARLTIILLGINDLDADDEPEAMFERYRRIVAQLPGRIVAVGILPCTDRLPRCSEFTPKIARFNAMLRTLPANKVTVVFPFRAMPDNFTYDGLHLTPEGFEALLGVLRPYIEGAR